MVESFFLCAHPVVCWPDTNLNLSAVVDEIHSLIEKSRRLIILLSKNYLAHGTRLELESGLHKALVERKIKIILIEFPPASSFTFLPPSLKLLKPYRVLKWKADNSLSYNSRFWKNLLYLMPAKPNKPWREESEALTVLSAPWSSTKLHVRTEGNWTELDWAELSWTEALLEALRVPIHNRDCHSKYRILWSSLRLPVRRLDLSLGHHRGNKTWTPRRPWDSQEISLLIFLLLKQWFSICWSQTF